MTTDISTIREDLRHLIEQSSRVGHFRFDDMVDSYVGKFGPRRFSELPTGVTMIDVLNLVDDHEIVVRVDRPCPSWCELEPGHRWDSYDNDGRELRGHGRSLSDHVSIGVTEYADEPAISETPSLRVSVDDWKDRTPAEVRQLAAELLNAADEFDTVTRDGAL